MTPLVALFQILWVVLVSLPGDALKSKEISPEIRQHDQAALGQLGKEHASVELLVGEAHELGGEVKDEGCGKAGHEEAGDEGLLGGLPPESISPGGLRAWSK